jgi:hypothetical protein
VAGDAVVTHPAFPLRLHLPLPGAYPQTVYAEYVPGSSPPAYTVNGEPCAVEVQIPDDLAALGYFWHGSLLCKPGDQSGGICTATYPPPGWPSPRENCFELARESERRRAEWAAQRVAERVAKATKTKVPRPTPAAPELAQQELF